MKLLILAILVAGAAAANLEAAVCGPVCMIYCPLGNVLNDAGCPTCKCNTAPIQKVDCAPVLCKMFCFNGWKKNEDGCDICSCA